MIVYVRLHNWRVTVRVGRSYMHLKLYYQVCCFIVVFLKN